MKTALEQIRYERGDTVRIIDRTAVLHDCTGTVVSVSHPVMVFVEVDVVTSSGAKPRIPYYPRELMLLEPAPKEN